MPRMTTAEKDHLDRIGRRQWENDHETEWRQAVLSLAAAWNASSQGAPIDHELLRDIRARVLAGPKPYPTDQQPGPAFPIDSHQLRCLYDWASHDHDAASIQLESLPTGALRATQGDDSAEWTRGDDA